MPLFRRKPQPRDNRRILVTQDVTIRAFDSVLPFEAVTGNLSVGGMFVPTLAPLPAGSEFDFDLALGYETISGRARVVWMREFEDGPDRPAGMGAIFEDVSPAALRQLASFIEAHLQTGATVQVGNPEALAKDGPFDGLFGARSRSPAMRPATPAARRDSSRRPVAYALLLALAIVAGGIVLAPRVSETLRGLVPVAGGDPSQRAAAQLQRPPITGAPTVPEAAGAASPGGDPGGETAPEAAIPEPRPARPSPEPPSPRTAVSEPSPPAVSPPVDLPSPPRSGRTLSGLDDILVQRDGSDLVVTLVADGAIARWDHLRLDSGNPRELVRLYGVSRPYAHNRVPADGRELRQIRTGYHRDAGGDQLHVVLDLATPDVRLVGTEEEEGRLSLRLRRD